MSESEEIDHLVNERCREREKEIRGCFAESKKTVFLLRVESDFCMYVSLDFSRLAKNETTAARATD